jgi:hypothetical protein
VAPNYAGYDTSTLPYHPYLIADQQSKDMIDALGAARTALPLVSATLTKDDGQLFITGYSQGGYVAMATDRAMQAAGMKVTAAAPMSGPYALGAFVDAVFYGEVNGGAPISSTLLLTAYQKAYGNIYADAVDVFESPYAAGIDSLLPTTTTRSDLYSQNKLPEFALFSLTPPAPAFAADTPPTSRRIWRRFLPWASAAAICSRIAIASAICRTPKPIRTAASPRSAPGWRPRRRHCRSARRCGRMICATGPPAPRCYCAAAPTIRWSFGSTRG